MNQIEFIKHIKQECTFLELDDFHMRQSDRNIYYEKYTDTDGVRISLCWTEYHDVHVSSLHASKRFNIVENPIKDLLGGDLKEYYTIHVMPSLNQIPTGLKNTRTGKNIHFVINSLKDLKLYIEFLKTFYSQKVKPFLNEFKSLNNVNNKLKELLENKNIQSLITDSGGNSAIVRLYTIALLNKNSAIEEFFVQTYYPYMQNQTGNELAEKELVLLREIKARL